ncbi:maltose operon protein MalM [Xenorhabdus stockiae]|uniref:Maltose operon protein MalM n=2 Tax=Xenorhabdus stockiae TaxID=351614 RepID=A0A2D0KMW8_9GAMM|nr:maltose operon protein MalM [Xenorhabdus stockiae]
MIVVKGETMKTKLITLFYYSILSCISLPLVAYAAGTVSEKTMINPEVSNNVAYSIPASVLQKQVWKPMKPPAMHTIVLSRASPQINEGNIQGAIATLALPASQGALKITLSSLIKDKQVYLPNVLVFDEKFQPVALYASHSFSYQQPGIFSGERVERTLKITPVSGQKNIYLLIYTTHADLQTSTKMVDPAKAYAQGVGNAVPNIPDPIALHTDTGILTLKVTSERTTENVLADHTFVDPNPNRVPKSISGETEQHFNEAIKKAIKNGDINKALTLLDEAERLGSSSARETFIKMIKSKESS